MTLFHRFVMPRNFGSTIRTSLRREAIMDLTEFRKRGKEVVDFLADYLDTIEDRRVTPDVKPGFLLEKVPTEAPKRPATWNAIFEDFQTNIVPGISCFQHPYWFGYYPSQVSYPSMLGEMLTLGSGNLVASWATSPAGTELENIVVDWMGKMIGLPDKFLYSSGDSKGGGVIQGTSSESVFVSLLAARDHKLMELKKLYPLVEKSVLLSKLKAYCSKDAHSCVIKAAMMSMIHMRTLDTDANDSLSGDTLLQAMREDEALGLIPFYVLVTLGSTPCCGFDNLSEIGPICDDYGIWLHVDAAYAGNSFICPELRGPMKGIEHAWSFNVSPSKSLLIHFDCAIMWVKDRFILTETLEVAPLYLQHKHSDKSIDYRIKGFEGGERAVVVVTECFREDPVGAR